MKPSAMEPVPSEGWTQWPVPAVTVWECELVVTRGRVLPAAEGTYVILVDDGRMTFCGWDAAATTAAVAMVTGIAFWSVELPGVTKALCFGAGDCTTGIGVICIILFAGCAPF